MPSFSTTYGLGDIVYLKTDPDQTERMIIQIALNGKGVSYELVCGTTSSWHYDIEISDNKDYSKI